MAATILTWQSASLTMWYVLISPRRLTFRYRVASCVAFSHFHLPLHRIVHSLAQVDAAIAWLLDQGAAGSGSQRPVGGAKGKSARTAVPPPGLGAGAAKAHAAKGVPKQQQQAAFEAEDEEEYWEDDEEYYDDDGECAIC